MADVNEQERLLLQGRVKDLAPIWGDDIERALVRTSVTRLRGLVEELNVANQGGGIAVTYSAEPDLKNYVFCHRLTRVGDRGRLEVSRSGGIYYSDTMYAADFAGFGDEELQLHLLRDTTGICAEKAYGNLLVCSPDTTRDTLRDTLRDLLRGFSRQRLAASGYGVRSGGTRLERTAFYFGYASGVVASTPSAFMPPTRRVTALDYLQFSVDGDGKPEAVRYHYNGTGRSDPIWPDRGKQPYRIDGSNVFIQSAFAFLEIQNAVVAEVREGRSADDLWQRTRITAPLGGKLPVANLGEVRVDRRRSPKEQVDVAFLDSLATAVFSLAPRP